MISRIAESFHVLPAVAERLWLDDPDETALQILELRSYEAAKAAYDSAGGKVEDLEQHPMLDEVIENVFILQRQRLAGEAEESD
jgi:hypothetical protein|tara:strand:+ start:764 stop:1015 length:252 start_codon:yes stop_codon:yes gene_type:complete